jgi:phage-related protein
MLNLGKSLIKGLGKGIKSLGSWIKSSAKGILESIKTPFGHPGEILTNIGKQLIHGLWSGIKSVKNWILSKISGFMDDIVGGIKGFFGIHSPSKLMEKEIGKFIPPGITVGMDKAMPGTIQNMKDQLAGMMEKARTAISAEQAKVGASFHASTQYQVALAGGYGTGKEAAEPYTGPSVVEAHFDLQGREFASATAPVESQQQGWKKG